MTKAEYITALNAILRVYTQDAVDKINSIRDILPSNASAVEVGIHPTQDEDGIFSVMIHLRGPDLFMLNKAITSYRELFDVKYIESKHQPEVPSFDPGDALYSVNDLIVEICIGWLKQIWVLSGGLGVPAFAFGEECSAPEGLIPLGC